MQKQKRRHSSAVMSKNMKLTKGFDLDKENGVSPINFDENYMMFGGDKYKEVIPIITPE